MWYEILPSFFAFAGLISVPFILVPTMNYAYYGKPMVRQSLIPRGKEMMLRDQTLDRTKKMNCNFANYWEVVPDADDDSQDKK